MPVLAARLLGPLKMSGKQTGWIYATLPLASMLSPMLFGHAADKWINVEYLLAISHLIGAALLFVAAKQTRFISLFVVMLVYTFFYAATLALVNTIVFRHMPADVPKEDVMKIAATIFIWAPIGWASVGYFLTGLRQIRQHDSEGRDAFYLAAAMSAVLTLVCVFQPKTEPLANVQKAPSAAQEATVNAGDQAAETDQPMVRALAMLKDPTYLLFIVVSFAVAGTMQFYFVGSAPFMQAMGISSKNVPATMAIAQAVQAIATLFILGLLFAYSPKWTLVIGSLCWSMLYLIYVGGRPRWLIVAGQSFHGLAYVLFIVGGWGFADSVAPEAVKASAQSILITATNGIGLFLGTMLAGFTMDRFKAGEQIQWSKVWMVPLAITLTGALALAVAFYPPEKKPADTAPPVAAVQAEK
jgi:MFS family permease